MNTLLELKEAGQSVWIDYLSRELIRSGELRRPSRIVAMTFCEPRSW